MLDAATQSKKKRPPLPAYPKELILDRLRLAIIGCLVATVAGRTARTATPAHRPQMEIWGVCSVCTRGRKSSPKLWNNQPLDLTNTRQMLYLIGLGLGDETDITVKGLSIVKKAARVYLEAYTSILLVDKAVLVRHPNLPRQRQS